MVQVEPIKVRGLTSKASSPRSRASPCLVISRLRASPQKVVEAMALDGSYESKLLRVLIGYSHVSLLQQVALTQYGKGFHLLNQEEKNNLENEVLGTVFHIAHHLTDEALSGGLNPPSIN
jgi:hypothetical protein